MEEIVQELFFEWISLQNHKDYILRCKKMTCLGAYVTITIHLCI